MASRLASRVLGMMPRASARRLKPALASMSPMLARSMVSLSRPCSRNLPTFSVFDSRSHSRVQLRGFAGGPVKEWIPLLPSVPNPSPNSGGHPIPDNPVERAPISTAVYITATSVDDTPTDFFPDPGDNWYRRINSFTGLKGLARLNYLEGNYRAAWGWSNDAGVMGRPRNWEQYWIPTSLWLGVIMFSKEYFAIDAEFFYIPLFWLTWLSVITFGRPVLMSRWNSRSGPKRERYSQKLDHLMYTIKHNIQTHHDSITHMRNLPEMAASFASLFEQRQHALNLQSHHKFARFIESYLADLARREQARRDKLQAAFERGGMSFVRKVLANAKVQSAILDSSIASLHGGNSASNPIATAFNKYVKTVTKAGTRSLALRNKALPTLASAVSKFHLQKNSTLHDRAMKIKEVGGPDWSDVFVSKDQVPTLTTNERRVLGNLARWYKPFTFVKTKKGLKLARGRPIVNLRNVMRNSRNWLSRFNREVLGATSKAQLSPAQRAKVRDYLLKFAVAHRVRLLQKIKAIRAKKGIAPKAPAKLNAAKSSKEVMTQRNERRKRLLSRRKLIPFHRPLDAPTKSLPNTPSGAAAAGKKSPPSNKNKK